MIQTQQQRIPWWWVSVLALPAGIDSFVDIVSSTALTFTIRKFTADPALIMFLGSINLAFNFLVAPIAAWKSDRIWTRIGRRKPFLIVGWMLLAVGLLLTPFASTLWLLVLVIVLTQAAADASFTGPWMPLYFEVVPPPQRGRAVAIKRVAMMGARMLFNVALIGKFDDVYHLTVPLAGRWTLTGEHIIYMVTAALVVACLFLVGFTVREVEPAQRLAPERFSLRRFAGSILALRQRRRIFLLLFAAVTLTVSLGQLQPLLITEQFGYGKHLMGRMHATVMAVELCLVLPLVAWATDRFDRTRLFGGAVTLSCLLSLLFFLFIKFVAPHQVPRPMHIIGFMVCHQMVRMAGSLAIEPVFFDLIGSNSMGTLNSGLILARGLISLAMVNGVGLWVKVCSAVLPAASRTSPDYSSGYLYTALCAGCGIIAYRLAQSRANETRDETAPATTDGLACEVAISAGLRGRRLGMERRCH